MKATIRNFESINVHYNTIVKEIIYGQPLEKGVTIITESNKIQKTFQADYVIVTFSLGVLKSKDVLFTPTLPPWKVESLMRFHMTIYTKIFFKFKANFWGDKEFTYFASQTRGYYPIWQSIPGNILFVTVTGSESKRLERMSDDDVFKEAMAVLKLLFKSKFQKPIDMVFPRWGIDPFFRGSYSNVFFINLVANGRVTRTFC